MGLLARTETWNFDIDRYINRVIPPSPLHRLPNPVSRFLGYRKEQKQDVGNVLGAIWSCVGAFCGLAIIAAAFNNTEAIQVHSPPALIASFVSSSFCVLLSIAGREGSQRSSRGSCGPCGSGRHVGAMYSRRCGAKLYSNY